MTESFAHRQSALKLHTGIPLEFAANTGGKSKKTLRELRTRGAPWRTALFGVGARRWAALESAVEDELKVDFGPPQVVLDGPHDEKAIARAQDFFRGFFGPDTQICVSATEAPEALHAPAAPSLQAWARLIFAGLADFLSDDAGKEILLAYEREMPLVRYFPWEDFRFFAGYLRTFRSELKAVAEVAALDWARFQAELSPHDEAGEAESLRPGEIMVNPTLQIVRRETRGEMVFVAREAKSSELLEQTANWMHAALVDKAAEEFRIGEAELLVQAASELRGAPAALKFDGALDDRLRESLQALLASGVLLKG